MPKANKQEKPSLGQEMLAVIMAVVACFLLLSLFSFSPPPETSSAAASVPANWGGIAGHFTALVLMGFLGVSSLLLPLLLLFFSGQIFFRLIKTERIPWIIGGSSGMLLAASTLLAVFGPDFSLLGRTYPLGGWLGNLCFGFTSTWFGVPGAVLFFLALFLCSLMAALRFSPYTWSGRVAAGCGRLNKKIKKKRSKKGKPPPASPEKISFTAAGDAPSVNEPISLPGEDEEDFQPLPVSTGNYQLPPMSLLNKSSNEDYKVEKDYYLEISKKLEEKLDDFGVRGKVTGISPGPVITTYEFAPAPGVKINKVVSLADDLALGLKSESVRVVGSIPGKAALGIEIPNPSRKIVFLRDILANEKFRQAGSPLTLALGMDVVGSPVLADLTRMPHLLIAGATGAGKSVTINVIISSILFKATPDEVRLLMIDPKRIELSTYDEIPHLLHPVVVDPKMASRALHWAVHEMERRYELMEEAKVKSFTSYNETAEEKLPLVVIIIDELADLMMVSSNEVEGCIARLAQMARAAGMHMIVATQRPSVDVLTGLIKANFPTRMSFKVSSKIDSRTILDTAGAEHLLGAGDMLFMPPGSSRLQRIHGAYISEKESEKIVDFLKEQGAARYDESVMQIVEAVDDDSGSIDADDYDEKYDEAVALVCESGQASISMIQRRLRVGYNRAARMIEIMEREGIVGPADGAKPREILARKSY